MTGRATIDKGAKVKRWERNLENPKAALKQIGVIMVAESQRAFKDQRFGREDWEERAVPNVFGIISDFHLGRRQPPARRFESRPALRDTGRLASSISFALKGTEVVEVGSNLPYAGVLHRGGKIESKPITEVVRQLLWKWLRGKGSAWRDRLGWLLNRKFRYRTLTAEVPPRPIVGITARTRRDIQDAVGAKIMEVR